MKRIVVAHKTDHVCYAADTCIGKCTVYVLRMHLFSPQEKEPPLTISPRCSTAASRVKTWSISALEKPMFPILSSTLENAILYQQNETPDELYG